LTFEVMVTTLFEAVAETGEVETFIALARAEATDVVLAVLPA